MEDLYGPTVIALRRKQRWSVIGWVTKNLYLSVALYIYLELLCASEGTSFAPAYTHRARVVGYGPFSLSVIVVHKEALCPSSGDTNTLMMMMKT
jgi:hypothetical protein